MVSSNAKLQLWNTKVLTFEIKADFESNFEDFELFWHSKPLTLWGNLGCWSLISDIKSDVYNFNYNPIKQI
jgi:hypothetical protein